PDRRNVLGRLQVVGRLEVRVLNEVTTHFGHKEHNETEREQEDNNTYKVTYRQVIREERHTIEGNTVLVLVLLDLNAIGVVGAHFVERQDVQEDQQDQHNRQSHHVKRKEAVQGNTGDQIVTANPLNKVSADSRNRTKQ